MGSVVEAPTPRAFMDVFGVSGGTSAWSLPLKAEDLSDLVDEEALGVSR